jgi:hypothetical protein
MSTPASKTVVDELRQRTLGALHEVAGGGNGAIDGAAAAALTPGRPIRHLTTLP